MKRFVASALTILTLAFSAAIYAPLAASAHDEIVSTTPAADSKVSAGQLKISVTFNEDVMDIPPHQGLAFEVTTPGGSKSVLECLDVNGVELAGIFNANETGEYTVNWRSVSSDGHPNAGTFNFKVTADAPAGDAPAPDSTCAAELAAASATPTDNGELDLTTAPATATDASGGTSNDSGTKLDPLSGLLYGIGLFVVLSVLGAFAAEMQKRRRARQAELKKLKAEVEANPDLLRDL